MWLQNEMQISDVYVQQGRAFLYRVLPCKAEGNCPNPFNVQHETGESDESCFESFDEWLYILYLPKLLFEKTNKLAIATRATERGAGGYNDPGAHGL